MCVVSILGGCGFSWDEPSTPPGRPWEPLSARTVWDVDYIILSFILPASGHQNLETNKSYQPFKDLTLAERSNAAAIAWTDATSAAGTPELSLLRNYCTHTMSNINASTLLTCVHASINLHIDTNKTYIMMCIHFMYRLGTSSLGLGTASLGLGLQA